MVLRGERDGRVHSDRRRADRRAHLVVQRHHRRPADNVRVREGRGRAEEQAERDKGNESKQAHDAATHPGSVHVQGERM